MCPKMEPTLRSNRARVKKKKDEEKNRSLLQRSIQAGRQRMCRRAFYCVRIKSERTKRRRTKRAKQTPFHRYCCQCHCSTIHTDSQLVRVLGHSVLLHIHRHRILPVLEILLYKDFKTVANTGIEFIYIPQQGH